MNNQILMHMLNSSDYLANKLLGFQISEFLPSFQKFIKSLITTYFQQNVDIVIVFKHMLKLNNVSVLDVFMDLDF